MPRNTSRSSYLSLPIERETVTVRQTIAMPYGGYKTTRVVEKKITLPRIPRGHLPPDPSEDNT